MKSEASVALPLVILNPKSWSISWQIGGGGGDTNMPADNVEFDVEKEDNILGPWYLFCRTNTPPVPFTFDGDQGYFRVGAHWIVEP